MPRLSKYIIECKKDRIKKNIDRDIKNGNFAKFKYANISRETFIEFCRLCADEMITVDLTKKQIDSYCGLMDLYESFNDFIEKNPHMGMDPQLGAIKHLFDNRLK